MIIIMINVNRSNYTSIASSIHVDEQRRLSHEKNVCHFYKGMRFLFFPIKTKQTSVHGKRIAKNGGSGWGQLNFKRPNLLAVVRQHLNILKNIQCNVCPALEKYLRNYNMSPIIIYHKLNGK